jgi:flagellar biosynthesis protein FlhG
MPGAIMSRNDQGAKVIHLSDRLGATAPRPAANAPRVIAVTSGKGGVGKTNIVANLGLSLVRYGKKVIILDADLGLGNLDVLLGLSPPFNLGHVIAGEKTLSQIVVEGPGGLMILPASSGLYELTRLSIQQQYAVFGQLETLAQTVDVVLIDTAAGISANVLFFSAAAHEILVVATPEPTSVTDAYALMKVLSLRYAESHFKLLVNQVADANEAEEVFRQLSVVAERFLKISIDYVGYVLTDRHVGHSVRRQRILTDASPESDAARCIATVARRLIHTPPPTPGKGKLFVEALLPGRSE